MGTKQHSKQGCVRKIIIVTSLFFSTYVCIRLLQCFGEQYTNQIQRAVNYIKTHIPAEPLSTALALLTLKIVGLNTDETAIILQEQLLATQNTSGGWEAMNFIKPKAYEPYKSEALTTARNIAYKFMFNYLGNNTI